MRQKYKSIYFADNPNASLTLAFGERDTGLHQAVESLSSEDLRRLLGHHSYGSLLHDAQQEGLAMNTYCLRLLRERMAPYSSDTPLLPGISDTVPIPIDPLQATYRGGQTEPFHTWYPLLEGYSPKFVRQVLQRFSADAKCVLDPFAGTGTTPITVSLMGRQAFYCEINPMLQYLTQAKIAALTASPTERTRAGTALLNLSENLEDTICRAGPDTALSAAYRAVFGKSKYFEDGVYDEVLRMRVVIDRLACAEPLASQFLTIAVLSSLIPASRLIRRGDLRYKTEKELSKKRVSFVLAVRGQLQRIANDVMRLDGCPEAPVLVCEDAKQLGKIPPLRIDTIVTSPPYLNGTNYFRNTKVELWFLRGLRSQKDLARFRGRSVTAGINDVTSKKSRESKQASVKDLVQQLASCAYDQRIPRMVENYFADMRAALFAAKRHLVNGATLLLDIGDSAYSNVHVPTDALLKEILTDDSFSFEDDVTLRRRMSRGGFPLRQILLAFRFHKREMPRGKTITNKGRRRSWRPRWNRFKAELPHQRGDYAKRNWGHPLHSLCSYQGKMKPSLASYLITTFVTAGDRLLDPFAGVGTIPFEGALRGVRTWGFEINPAALHIARAKLERPDATACERTLQELEVALRQGVVSKKEVLKAKEICFNGALPDYFHASTFREILIARRYFAENSPSGTSESMVFACLLHILHGNRPYALSRRSHPITPFSPSGNAEYRALLPRLRSKVSRSLNVGYPQDFLDGQMVFQDATSWWPQEVDRLDAVITSPPFFDSTRFYLANWMRLWFSGWEHEDFQTCPLAFVDERQKRTFDVYEPVLRQARERLRTGGLLVLHLGKSRKCDMAEALASVAKRWFRVADVFSESVAHCESHGIRDKGTVAEHQFLVLN